MDIAQALLQARLFSGEDVTIQALMGSFGVTRPIVMKRLKKIVATGLLQREKTGREVRYQLDLDALAGGRLA